MHSSETYSETSEENQPRSQRWTTTDEKEFIEGLGTHALNVGDSNFSQKHLDLAVKAELLMKYAKSMPNRVEWGEINKDKVSQYVREKIDLLKKQIQQVTSKALEHVESLAN